MKKINIVSVFTWFSNVLDTYALNSSEQLVMLHIIKHLNRNFWRPINISKMALSRLIGKDSRTIATAMTSLKKKHLLMETEYGIFINAYDADGNDDEDENKKRAEKASKNTNAQTAKATHKQVMKAKNADKPFKNKAGDVHITEDQIKDLNDMEARAQGYENYEQMRMREWAKYKEIRQKYNIAEN